MATPAQAAAATVGAGSLAAAGAYGITQAVNGSEEETNTEEQEVNTPSNPSTFTAQDLNSETYTNKFLALTKEENLKFLVKPDNNKEWWDWAFKNKYEKLKEDNQRHDLFTNVNSPETLKTACQKAYIQDKSKYIFDNDYLLENVSTFCTKGAVSIDISEPKVVFYSGTVTGYDNKLLSVEGNKAKLVKYKIETNEQNTNHNDLWWKWAFKNVFVKQGAIAPFDTVTKGYSDAQTDNTALNHACDAGYKKLYFELTANSNALIKAIKKYCSTDKTEDLLGLPDPATPSYVDSKADGTSNYSATNALVKQAQNKTKLVDPDLDTNQNWWVWNFDKLFPKAGTTEHGRLEIPFNTVTSAYSSDTGAQSPATSLNKACKETYNKTKSGFPENANSGKDKLLDLVKKFCSPATVGNDIAAPTAE